MKIFSIFQKRVRVLRVNENEIPSENEYFFNIWKGTACTEKNTQNSFNIGRIRIERNHPLLAISED